MKPAFIVMAAALLLPAPSFAMDSSRQLHYIGTTQIGGQTTPMSIDIEVSSLDRYATSQVDIEERAGNRDLGPVHVMLGRSGILEGDMSTQLTFEEEALVDVLALQFEDLGGVDPGDTWDRNHIHYVVRKSVDGVMDFDVARTIEFSDGSRGGWRGSMRYNATTVVPTSIAIAGELIDDVGSRKAIRMSARLAEDSFRP